MEMEKVHSQPFSPSLITESPFLPNIESKILTGRQGLTSLTKSVRMSPKINAIEKRSISKASTLLQEPAISNEVIKKGFKERWALKKMVRNLYGLSVRETPAQCVEEEWAGKAAEDIPEDEEAKLLFASSSWIVILSQALLTISYLLACWCITIQMVFEIRDGLLVRYITPIWMSVLLIDILINLNTVRLVHGKSLRTRRAILLEYVKGEIYLDLMMAAYFIVHQLDVKEELLFTLNISVFAALLWKLKLKSERLRFQFSLNKYIVLVESVLLLLSASHFSALLLFLSSKFVPQTCWLGHIGILNAGWSTKYIYSLYWAVTTIVTVGYGDITPQNEHEVAVTICIELMGSALFGYLINVIGATMSELKYSNKQFRKQKENLSTQLGIADKFVKCLSLKEDLAYQLSSFLKDNQKADAYFSLNDEKRIWDKLNPDLRQRILKETNIRVIKKCLFFLTYFSRNLQQSMALKMVKRVFQPNERLGLLDANGVSLYIIDQGRADLQFTRMHFSKPVYKTLRVINKEKKSDKLQISSNLLGYTAIVLRRNVNLTALSKQFIVTYQLLQKDFDELVEQQPMDFESVCQLRDNIKTTNIPESYEGPELLDPKRHFIPLKYMVVRKLNRNQPQPRRSRQRRPHHLSDRYDCLEDGYSEEGGVLPANFSGRRYCARYSDQAGKVFGAAEIISFGKQLQNEFAEALEKRESIKLADFDKSKIYSKYFVKSNIDCILKRFNPVEQFMTKSKRLKSRKQLAR